MIHGSELSDQMKILFTFVMALKYLFVLFKIKMVSGALALITMVLKNVVTLGMH